MGQLRDKRIVQSRIWLDPNQQPIPSYDYDYSYPITVYEAVRRSMDDTSCNLLEELESIYRLINGKQDIIEPGVPGQLMTWSGVRGQIGITDVAKAINSDPALRSHQKIPTERAVGDQLDTKTPMSAFNAHTNNNSIHTTDIEKNRWNSMAPLSSLQAHAGNTHMHITEEERGRWNAKANQSDFENHIYDTTNPHNVTAHQVGTYTRREIDEMFENLRESFFNYLNVEWDDRTNQASLVEYHPSNWNPNYVLAFGDELPDVPDPTLTYFALKPATDYQTNETQDCIIYIKRPGLVWQEVGFQSMGVGDMVIRYPDTSMYVWVQGRFLKLFTGNSESDAPGESTSNLMWRPVISEEGELTWVRSKETDPPGPFIIKGEDGKTPVKGVDYVDGIDGKGVPPGGAAGELLVKLTDESYETTWKSMLDILADMVLAGGTLPEGIVTWEQIKGRPNWYDELGDHTDGFITQRAATHQFEVVNNQITQILEKIDGPTGVDKTKNDLRDHLNDFNNPHRVTPTQIGAVSNMTFMDHVQNFNNPHNVTKAQIGLGNVDNTSDMDKPVSNATQVAIDQVIDMITKLTSDTSKYNYIANVSWNSKKATLTFTYKDRSEVQIQIPIADVFNSLYFDEVTHELVLVLPDGTENRINIAGMIQSYFGSISENIQVQIGDDHIVRATIIPGTVGEYEIAASVHLRASPTTTTQPISDKSTRIATTEFVRNQVIDNLISYETDRPLSANMGRILNQRKADIEDIIDILSSIEGIAVIDDLESTSAVAALSANMGRHLDLTKAPRIHTSPSGSTYGRATISLFGHARASDVDPLMDGTVFRGTDDGLYARGDHRHPTDITRAPIHFPDVAHNQYAFTGEPRSTLPEDDSNNDRIATTEWVRRNAVGVNFGTCATAGNVASKAVILHSEYMADPVFIRQQGSTVVVRFDHTDLAATPTMMNVQGTGYAPVKFAGKTIVKNMISEDHYHIFTFDGSQWNLLNPAALFELDPNDDSNRPVTAHWVNNNMNGVVACVCTTRGNYAVKSVRSIPASTEAPPFVLKTGAAVSVTFSEDDVSSSAYPSQLNVDGTGAKIILYAGKALLDKMLGKKFTHFFVFDGVYWRLINPADETFSGGGIVIGPGPGPTPTPDPVTPDPGPDPDDPDPDDPDPIDPDPDDPDPDDPDPVEPTDDTVVNLMSGYNGFTLQGDGPIDDAGKVKRVWFQMTFTPQAVDLEIKFSPRANAFAAKMGNGDTIILNDPLVVNLSRSDCVVQFTMDTAYPSNSPCQLVYRTKSAYINIRQKT